MNPRTFLDWKWKRQNAECQRHNHCSKREDAHTWQLAALAIDEEQQKRLNEAEEQEKAIPPQRMTQRKAWVRE